MATARPGWSRRAQYGLFFSFLAVIAGIVIGLVLLVLSLVAPKTFDGVRGAALDITGPVAGALHEVTATASGLVSGAGDYWDAAQPERAAQARAHGDAPADGRGQGDLPGEPAAQGRAAAARARARHGRRRPHRRLVVQQPAPVRDPVGRPQRRRADRHAGALAGRPGRADHRCRRARLARPAGLRPREHRARAAAARRHPGHCAGPRRRHDRRPPARGRPQPVQARRHHHHFGHRRPLSAAGADRAGGEARRRRRGRPSARRSVDHQLRDRRAAVRARRGRGRESSKPAEEP